MLRRVPAVSGALVIPAVITAVITAVLTACATPSISQQQPPDIAIHGTVSSAPTCPVERIGTPCPPRPAGDVLVEVLRGEDVVSATRTDAGGQFLLHVVAGEYDVRATAQGGYQATVTKPVTAKVDVTVDLVLDSGIR